MPFFSNLRFYMFLFIHTAFSFKDNKAEATSRAALRFDPVASRATRAGSTAPQVASARLATPSRVTMNAPAGMYFPLHSLLVLHDCHAS
jgi:hypothetical protein